MMLRHLSLAAAVAFVLAIPAVAEEASPPTPQAKAAKSAPAPAKRAVKRTIKRSPRSYGFLPGYEPPPDNNRPDYRRNARSVYADGRYVSWAGTYYGWGRPGYVHGRWNGGSIGPCYTQTPIGLIWTCGR
jgi:hypothetical protein